MDQEISGIGLLHASRSIQGKDYYNLVGLPTRQVNVARVILKENYYMLVSLQMRRATGVRDIRKRIITC